MASPPSGGGGSCGGVGGELFDLMSPNPHEEAESHARHGHCSCHGGGVDEVMPSNVFQPIRAAAPAAAALASATSLRGSLDSMAASSNLKKGTIVEKSVEEVTKDSQHLRHLISICEEERQVGETALNDTSSRSHQIIRLTMESRLREVSGCVKSFVASLNFVDLAGSEQAAQTHANGARLKEGCHINRSLLTLTTVIRKLMSGFLKNKKFHLYIRSLD